MKEKWIKLLCLCMILGTCCYAQQNNTWEKELNQPKLILGSDAPPVYIGPGNITKELGKLKKGTESQIRVDFNGETQRPNQEWGAGVIQRKAYQVTGYNLAEASHILNAALDGNGKFTAHYRAETTGPIDEVIKVTSTTGSFFVYLKGEVVE